MRTENSGNKLVQRGGGCWWYNKFILAKTFMFLGSHFMFAVSNEELNIEGNVKHFEITGLDTMMEVRLFQNLKKTEHPGLVDL